jgi:hypothetical protein
MVIKVSAKEEISPEPGERLTPGLRQGYLNPFLNGVIHGVI